MKNILKYVLMPTDVQTLSIQSYSVLSVQEQKGDIVVYALVDHDLPVVEYEFRVVGTGHTIAFNPEDMEFLGTVKLHNGALMFHIFCREVTQEKPSTF